MLGCFGIFCYYLFQLILVFELVENFNFMSFNYNLNWNKSNRTPVPNHLFNRLLTRQVEIKSDRILFFRFWSHINLGLLNYSNFISNQPNSPRLFIMCHPRSIHAHLLYYCPCFILFLPEFYFPNYFLFLYFKGLYFVFSYFFAFIFQDFVFPWQMHCIIFKTWLSLFDYWKII